MTRFDFSAERNASLPSFDGVTERSVAFGAAGVLATLSYLASVFGQTLRKESRPNSFGHLRDAFASAVLSLFATACGQRRI